MTPAATMLLNVVMRIIGTVPKNAPDEEPAPGAITH